MKKNKGEARKRRFLELNVNKIHQFVTTPEGFFLIFAAVFGLFFVFVTPPMQVPDEQTHFYQAYQYSKFKLLPDKFVDHGVVKYGPELPKSVFHDAEFFRSSVAGQANKEFNPQIYTEYIDHPLNPGQQEHRYGGNSYAAPIPYIPQIIGVSIGRLLEFSTLVIIWLGRLANLAAWLAVVYLAIRLLPFGRWAAVVLALNPVTVFLSASMSPDVMNIALSLLFFSLVARAYVSKKALTNGEIARLLVVLAMLALCKPVNVVFAMLLVAIPWKNMVSKKRLALLIAAGFVLAAGFALAANQISAEVMKASSSQIVPPAGVEPTKQLVSVAHNPIGYVKKLIINYVIVTPGSQADAVFVTYFGVFGWLDTSIPLWVVALYIILLAFTLLYQLGRGSVLSIYQKLTVGSTMLLVVIGSITALFIYWTPVGGTFVQGVQGRYFMPAAVLAVGIFTSKKKLMYDIKARTLSTIVGSVIAVVLGMTALRILLRYYI